MDRQKITITCAGSATQPACSYYRADGWRTLDKCEHPELARPADLVRGRPSPTYCDSAREGKCGAHAAHYQPKDGTPRPMLAIDFPPA